jgi:hypothetical protein
MSHHKGRLGAIRATSTVIGENRRSSETQFFGGQSINKLKLNRLKMQRGTSRSPEGLLELILLDAVTAFMALLVIPHREAYIISDNGQIKIVLVEYQIRVSQRSVGLHQLTVS